MYRAMGGVGIVMGLAVLGWAEPTPKQSMSVVQKMNQRVSFDGIDDVRATLNDALEKLSKLYDTSFEINDNAFDSETVQGVKRTAIAEQVPIPEMKNVRLSRLLNTILRRVPAQSGATYTIRDDHIEITTNSAQRAEIWGSYRGPYLPLVNATLDKCPLEDAVRQLAEQAEFTILVDGRAADKVKTPVSARLLNTPLDTALRLLTDMADLRTVQLDNVLYVTTQKNAAALEERLENEKGPEDDQAPDGIMQGKWRKGAGHSITMPQQ
jgi:hypothetical protein